MWFFPYLFLFLVTSRCLLLQSLSNSIDNSSLPRLNVFTWYIKEAMWPCLMFPKCFSEDDDNLFLLNKALPPKLTNLIASLSPSDRNIFLM